MTDSFQRNRGVVPCRGGAVVREELVFLERAFRLGRSAQIDRGDIPLLNNLPGCRVQDGFYRFPILRTAVTKVSPGERLFAFVLFVLLLPLLGILALSILLCDGWPIFFTQERTGYFGRPFSMYKFRTMRRNSEKIQPRLERHRGQHDRTFKLSEDPRVTRLGHFLRESFLDELPQLLNIIKGEMRFCGPRPLPPSDHGHYVCPSHALRLLGKPGLTGLWQVGGRNEHTFDEMCLLDYYYLCNRSLMLDTTIFLHTLRLFLRSLFRILR